jgi:hypothetical protein
MRWGCAQNEAIEGKNRRRSVIWGLSKSIVTSLLFVKDVEKYPVRDHRYRVC